MSAHPPIIQLRPGQQEIFNCLLGIAALLWRRQYGKSYTLGAIGLDWMMERVCDTFFVSAAVRLGLENIRKEAAIWRQIMGSMKEAYGKQVSLGMAEDDRGQILDIDAICDLFEAQKLETKLYHTQATYSRSMVVAPNPDTAVGWTGNVIMDEVGRIPNFRDVWEAMEPIVSSGKDFKIRLATTPPPDDSHYSYEFLSPESPEEFPVNPKGNWYRSGMGIPVHRLDAWDGYESGVPLYDLETRSAMTPEEHRSRSTDKTAWDRNYGCQFISGGASALSLMDLFNAQTAGRGQGMAINITDQLTAA